MPVALEVRLYSVTVPFVVILPTALILVNQRFPSGPLVIP